MVAEQRDAVLHQSAHTLAEFFDQDTIFAIPETVRMVYYNTVGLFLDSRIDQTVTERNSRHDSVHLVGRLYAEAIIAIILKCLRD